MEEHERFQLFTSLRYDPLLLQVRASNLSHAGWNWANSSPLYMLDYHRDRMLQAAMHWGWDDAVRVLDGDAGLKILERFILDSIEGRREPLRLKVHINREGVLSKVWGPVPETTLEALFPEQLPPPGKAQGGAVGQHVPSRTSEFDVSVDDVRVAWSEYSHFKTTERAVYDGARERAHISLTDKREALIIDETSGSIMEGSITTPYFWREGRWVTPAVRLQTHSEKGVGGQNGTSRRWALERGLVVEDTIHVDSLVDGEESWLSTGVRGFFPGRVRLG